MKQIRQRKKTLNSFGLTNLLLTEKNLVIAVAVFHLESLLPLDSEVAPPEELDGSGCSHLHREIDQASGQVGLRKRKKS